MSEPLIPWPDGAVAAYDMGIPPWRDTPWTPLRNVFERPRWVREAVAAQEAREADRKEWIETIRQRYGLVTIDGGLPRQPCGMTADGSYEGWCLAHLVSGRPESPAVWRLSNPPDPLEGLTDFQKLGYWNEMSIRERSAPGEDFERLSREIASRMRGEEVAGWRAASAPALPSPVADL